MDAEREQAWNTAFSLLVTAFPHWAPQDDRELAMRQAVWDQSCSDFAPEQIVLAAQRCARECEYPPVPAIFRQAVLGKLVREPVYVTDVWGRKCLRADGTAIIEKYVEKRIPFEEPDPGALLEDGNG